MVLAATGSLENGPTAPMAAMRTPAPPINEPLTDCPTSQTVGRAGSPRRLTAPQIGPGSWSPHVGLPGSSCIRGQIAPAVDKASGRRSASLTARGPRTAPADRRQAPDLWFSWGGGTDSSPDGCYCAFLHGRSTAPVARPGQTQRQRPDGPLGPSEYPVTVGDSCFRASAPRPPLCAPRAQR